MRNAARRLLQASFLLAAALSGSAQSASLSQPYKKPVTNFAHNLLFCDVPGLFIQNKALKPENPLYRVLHAGVRGVDAVRAIANDTRGDSCTRMLAFDWLRAHKQAVPPKVLLGVVFELGSKGGPAVVAAYADGNVRYISDTEELASFGPNTPPVTPKANDLLAQAQKMIVKMDPWKEPRVVAPPFGVMRITFLASGGLYFGDGELRQMMKDKFGGAVVHSAVDLLKAVSK